MFGFWSADEWERFREWVEDAAEQAGIPGTVDTERGVLVSGTFEASLETLARRCREQPIEWWRATIATEVANLAEQRSIGEHLATAGFAEARPLLRSVVVRQEALAQGCVSRPVGADLVETLTLTLPGGQLMSVYPGQARQWQVDRTELFAIGRANVRAEPVQRRRVDDLAVYELHSCDGSLVAPYLLLLNDEPGIGPYGCLVVVPNQHSLAYHPIEGPECLGHEAAWETLVRYASQDGIHQRLSEALYWWRSGQLTEIPTSRHGNELRISLPASFVSMIEGGDPEPGLPATPTDTDPAYGDPDPMAVLGAYLFLNGRMDDAEPWLRRAAARGHLEAMCNLGALYLQSGRTEDAERSLRQAAERGSDGAMANLGAVLDNTGRGEDAEAWFRRAAERGNTHGMHMLGRLLNRTGRAAEAERWFHRAAEVGSTGAMVDLSEPLVRAKRYDEAEPWLRRAAEQGAPEAMFWLGLVLGWTGRTSEAADTIERAAERGHPGARNVAERWFVANAELGHTDWMRRLGKVLAGAERAGEARQWYQRAAEAGDAEAMRELAFSLEQAGDIAQAEVWYRSAIEGGNTDAMYDFGCMLAKAGRGEQAEHWYREAADHGVVRAMTNLGALLRRTERVGAAEEWTRQAADRGSTVAMANLGELLVERAAQHRRGGEDAAADAALAEAEQWFRKAAEAGSGTGMFALGVMAEIDHPGEALEWFRRAAEAGHTEALDRLAALLDR